MNWLRCLHLFTSILCGARKLASVEPASLEKEEALSSHQRLCLSHLNSEGSLRQQMNNSTKKLQVDCLFALGFSCKWKVVAIDNDKNCFVHWISSGLLNRRNESQSKWPYCDQALLSLPMTTVFKQINWMTYLILVWFNLAIGSGQHHSIAFASVNCPCIPGIKCWIFFF